MQDIVGYRVQIRLGIADGLVILQPQDPQVYFLNQVRQVRRIAQACGEEAPQLDAVRFPQCRYERSLGCG